MADSRLGRLSVRLRNVASRAVIVGHLALRTHRFAKLAKIKRRTEAEDTEYRKIALDLGYRIDPRACQ